MIRAGRGPAAVQLWDTTGTLVGNVLTRQQTGIFGQRYRAAGPTSVDIMISATTSPRLTSLAPQFLVDDLERAMGYYRQLGFSFGEPWDGFYAIGHLDGLELHLKEAPKFGPEREHRRTHQHLDAAAGVEGIDAFYARCVASGVTILRPLLPTAWGTKDFYVVDPDGYIIAFGGR